MSLQGSGTDDDNQALSDTLDKIEAGKGVVVTNLISNAKKRTASERDESDEMLTFGKKIKEQMDSIERNLLGLSRNMDKILNWLDDIDQKVSIITEIVQEQNDKGHKTTRLYPSLEPPKYKEVTFGSQPLQVLPSAPPSPYTLRSRGELHTRLVEPRTPMTTAEYLQQLSKGKEKKTTRDSDRSRDSSMERGSTGGMIYD